MESKTCKEETEQLITTEVDEEAQADIDVWKYILGFTDMAVVKCAIELGIADVIGNHDAAVTLTDLAASLSCDDSCLYRIMRFLTHQKIFRSQLTADGAVAYAHTPLSRRLMRLAPNSAAAFVLFESSPAMLAPWHKISARVLANGESFSPFIAANGADVWEHAEADPEHGRLLDEAMGCNARVAVPAVVDKFPEVFRGIRTLVDVGGGNGTALRILVKAFPWIKGINFDLPHVAEAAPKSEGIENVGGDMFESIPKADAAFFMHVLHDWGDEECIRILRNCKESIGLEGKGKVIIVESVVADGDYNNSSDHGDYNSSDHEKSEKVRLMLDMVMMAHTNKGKERTLKEWSQLLQLSGFTQFHVKSVGIVQSLILAFP